jgi:hypothetical protein
MKYILPVVFVCFVFFCTSAFSICAVSLVSSNIPSSIDQNSEFDADVLLTCKGCDISYVRGVFYPSGTSYFGFTQNKNGDWINVSGGNCSQYYQVVLGDFSPEGTWSGKIKVKPDVTSPLYSGPGEYLFKIARYSSGCSTTWSQESTIAITGPTHTPTPTETPVPTNTQTPTHTVTPASTQTSTPTLRLTPSSTTTPTQKISPASGGDETGDTFLITEAPSVLGVTQEVSTTSATGEFLQKKILIISLALIGSGLAVLTTAVAYRIVLKQSESNPV